MTYNDLKKFSDTAGIYLDRLGKAVLPYYLIVNEDGINEIVPLLHRATDEFKIEELRAMLNDEWERTDRTELIGDYENVVYIVNQLLQLIKGYPVDLEEYDSDVDDLGVKVQTISHEMDEQLQNLRNRAETEPTQADKDSLKKLSKYVRISGIYKTFEEYLDLVIFKNVTDEIPMRRRANYLLKECCGDSGLKHYYAGIQNYVDAKLNPAPAETESPAPVKGEDLAKVDTSTIAPSGMKPLYFEFPFELLKLYHFLVDEGVIGDEIDVDLFEDCFRNAHINELWYSRHVVKNRRRNLLQCLFKVIANRWPNGWIDRCAENMEFKDKNLTNKAKKKRITNPTTSGATSEFEDKLRNILKQNSLK